MAIVRAMIAGTGSPPARYVEESFHFEDDQTPYASEAPIEAKPRQIRFAKTGRTFTCPPGSTILRAAKAAGVAIPFSCAKGVCGTCKSLKLSGTVTMTHGGGIRQREIDCGFILPSSSRPETDVVLDR